MSQHVIILGLKGRFGRAAANAFLNAGWRVRGLARNWGGMTFSNDIERVDGDAFDAEALTTAVAGCDVIVNALNPPYEKWQRDLPRLTENVIHAARAAQATVMIPGNVYNFGSNMPPVLTETTAHGPTTRKGKLRDQMEAAYAAAGDDGVRTIILRAGDFIEREKTGNWFDSYIANKVGQGKVTYPGPLDRVHAWAYLPDMARAMVHLADQRAAFGGFETFGFEGFNVTGAELITAMETACGQPLKVHKMPWPVMRLLAAFMPSIREVMEMKYLWDVPHAVDGAKLARTLPGFEATSLDVALADVLANAGPSRPPANTRSLADLRV